MTATVQRRKQGKSLCGLLGSLIILVFLWGGLTCAEDSDEELLRRYAECMADSNTVSHQQTFSNATGSVPLSAEAVEEWLWDRLATGEITMAEIRAGYARHCQ